MEIDYELDIPSLTETIKNRMWKKVLLQMPEGLLNQPLQRVLTALHNLNVTVFLESEPSYGVCDLAIDSAKQLDVDALIHYGHSSFGFEQTVQSARRFIDVVLIPARIRNFQVDLVNLIDEIQKLEWKQVGLTATIQHLEHLPVLKRTLESNQIGATISQDDGQILGCHIGKSKVNFRRANIDGVISLHPGNFHVRSMLFKTSWPILQIDPITGHKSLHSVAERDRIIKKRLALIEKARKATTWGILGSLRLGQWQPRSHTRVKKILNKDFRFIELVGKKISSEYLANFTWVDAWVNTACPRVALDDSIRFNRPMITFQEFLYIFSQITWEQLLERGFM